ncbi:MAG TPA: hypothetical protein VJJ55_03035 [Candidatus Paceibacterota bacterium]
MGSFIVHNDTLQLTREQGFPTELVLEKHRKNPFTKDDFSGKIFAFKDKPDIRNYQTVPVRNFLVENIDGKWLYWGLVHILEVTHDYEKKTTAGKFKIISIYPPEDMEKAFDLIDQRPDMKFPLD